MRAKKHVVAIALLSVAILAGGMAIYCYSQQRKREEHLQKITKADAADRIENREEGIVIYCGQESYDGNEEYLSLLVLVTQEIDAEVLYLDLDSAEEAEKWEMIYVDEAPALIVVADGSVCIYREEMEKEDVIRACNAESAVFSSTNGITEIDCEELHALLDDTLEFFLYIGRDDCRDCQSFLPVLEEYVSSGETGMYYLNLTEYRNKAKAENASEEDVSAYEAILEEFSIEWVPTLIHFRNGIQVSRYEFLSEEYYELPQEEQAESEEQYVTDFYAWISREKLFIDGTM
ncbi:MAG: thioredoxin family protein [Lachnospiraceae bacterium]|nr:thioredoxin family protein [Lachnospiraceae bacterium]